MTGAVMEPSADFDDSWFDRPGSPRPQAQKREVSVSLESIIIVVVIVLIVLFVLGFLGRGRMGR
jgi:hypothetical protein